MTDTPLVERRADGIYVNGENWISKNTTVDSATRYVDKYRMEVETWQADLAKAEAVLAFLRAEDDEKQVEKLAQVWHKSEGHVVGWHDCAEAYQRKVRRCIRAVLAAQREEKS